MSDPIGEFSASVILQCSALMGITLLLSRRRVTAAGRDKLWSDCYRLTLLLILTACFLPHLRLWRIPDWLSTWVVRCSTGFPGLLLTVLVRVWVAGAAVMALRLLLSLVHASYLVRHSVRHPALTPDQRSSSMNVPPEIRISGLLHSPMCWQFHRPVIVLPESVLDFPADELAVIIRHECGHLVLQHPFYLFLQRLVEIVFWFHPLTVACSRSSALQREIAADAFAVRSGDEGAALLRGLLRLSDAGAKRQVLPFHGLAFHGSDSTLSRRVIELVEHVEGSGSVQDRRSSFRWMLPVTAVLAAMIWLPLNVGASPRSVISPWPPFSASALRELGISVRDFEMDSHRINGEQHHWEWQRPSSNGSERIE